MGDDKAKPRRADLSKNLIQPWQRIGWHSVFLRIKADT
jgi:hypothetical protein